VPEAPPAAEAKRAQSRRARFAARAYQLIDYCFMLLYGLLIVHFLLGLIAANEQAGFVRFIRLITQPFYGPFADIVPSPAMGEGVFDMSLLMCLLAYMMLHLALRGLLHVTVGARARTDS
jgi:uncharacterized protein YggT (Ycf19 family)